MDGSQDEGVRTALGAGEAVDGLVGYSTDALTNVLNGQELVTSNDPQGRATIFDRLRVMGLTQHMMPVVGRSVTHFRWR